MVKLLFEVVDTHDGEDEDKDEANQEDVEHGGYWCYQGHHH